MIKRVVIVIDKSGSMDAIGFGGASKIQEAVNAVNWLGGQLIAQANLPGGDSFNVSVYKFANNPVHVHTHFFQTGDGPTEDLAFTTAVNSILTPDPALGGVLTDIFKAVDLGAVQVAAEPAEKNLLILFTDGRQTIPYGGGYTKAAYEAIEGNLAPLFSGPNPDTILRNIGLGSDLLIATLNDLLTEAAATSTTLAVDPAVESVQSALTSEGIESLLDNGLLPFARAGATMVPKRSEVFSLPRRAENEVVDFVDFEAQVDSFLRELLVVLIWYQEAADLQLVSPSGKVFVPGSAGTRVLNRGNTLGLHVEKPEAGLWKIRVSAKVRKTAQYHLLVRSISPEFKLYASAQPSALSAPGDVSVVVTPLFEGKPASGDFAGVVSTPGSDPAKLEVQKDGTLVGTLRLHTPGLHRISVDFEGKLKGVGKIRRAAFTSAQVGRPLDPTLWLKPSHYEPGRSYTVDVGLTDAQFTSSTQLSFGPGISVTAFSVLDPGRAQARISVDKLAPVGPRVVVSQQPAAETFDAVTVGRGGLGRPNFSVYIDGLRFAASGRLVGVVLGDERVVPVPRDEPRLLEVLERARDKGLPVSVEVDEDGELVWIDVRR